MGSRGEWRSALADDLFLASRRPDALVTTEFDGEGRFHRDREGRISHFVYYEFGRRLGVARKVQKTG